MSSRFSGVLGAIPAKRQLSEEAGRAVAAGVQQRLSAADIAASRAGGTGAPIGPGQLQGFGGYAQNPFADDGRARIAQQFMQAPLGGYVRDALDGQEVLGHRITNEQARMAEQGLAGLTAVGVGVPAFMFAVQQLSTPPDQNTIPM